LDVQAVGLVAATFLMGDIMYSNEVNALANAIEAMAQALRGEPFNAAIAVEGGKAYDGIREVCAKIVEAAEAVAGRTAADMAYDNGESGLTAVTVQDAIDELVARS
jgi:hypothetical protein